MSNLIITPDDAVADYIIQVSLTHRIGTANIRGAFHIWKKGGWFGSADELLRFCPAHGCTTVLKDAFIPTLTERNMIAQYGMLDPSQWPAHVRFAMEGWYRKKVSCGCGAKPTAREDLPDTYGFNMDADRIAKRMEGFYQALSSSADIYLVRTKEEGAFQKARNLLYSQEGRKFDNYKKELERARDRECVFYPMKGIIRDTSTGADLRKRFKALVEA